MLLSIDWLAWPLHMVDCVWNVMAHAQKPDVFFRRNGRVHLNRQGRQLSRLLAAEVCASTVVILDTPSSEVVWRVLVTHSIRKFPLHFPSRASPRAITFQLDCTDRLFGLCFGYCVSFHFFFPFTPPPTSPHYTPFRTLGIFPSLIITMKWRIMIWYFIIYI
jgi:hypothetical protein